MPNRLRPQRNIDLNRCLHIDGEEPHMRLVLPSETAIMLPGDLDRARQIAKEVAGLVDGRERYLAIRDVPRAFGLPAANWGIAAKNPFLQQYRRVLQCDETQVRYLRAFTQMFVGFSLYEMRGGVGTPIVAQIGEYPDAVIGARLSRNLPYVETWLRLTERMPAELLFRPPRRFGEIGHDVDGVIVNHDTVAYQERLNLLHKAGVLDRRRILEIGAGYGALASWFLDTFPGCHYTIIDLPECLLFSELYLSLPRPDDAPLRFVPNYAAGELKEPFDLVINTLSMSEMSEAQIRHYATLLREHWLTEGGVFFEQNQDNRRVGFTDAAAILAAELPDRLPIATGTQGTAHLWSLKAAARP
jgi:hypothetical protein